VRARLAAAGCEALAASRNPAACAGSCVDACATEAGRLRLRAAEGRSVVIIKRGEEEARAVSNHDELELRLRFEFPAGPGPPVPAKRPHHFTSQIGFAWRFCMGAQVA
jgi:sugar/nucleoside kinase (ribokinase family)